MLSKDLHVLRPACHFADIQGKGFFHGYTQYTWTIISIQAAGGLIVALVIKYADNIIKDFTGSIATILTCLFSAIFMDFHITLHFGIGFFFVMSGMQLYTAEGFLGLEKYNCCGSAACSSEVLDPSEVEAQIEEAGGGTAPEKQGLIPNADSSGENSGYGVVASC
jgi:hypothetical protein